MMGHGLMARLPGLQQFAQQDVQFSQESLSCLSSRGRSMQSLTSKLWILILSSIDENLQVAGVSNFSQWIDFYQSWSPVAYNSVPFGEMNLTSKWTWHLLSILNVISLGHSRSNHSQPSWLSRASLICRTNPVMFNGRVNDKKKLLTSL